MKRKYSLEEMEDFFAHAVDFVPRLCVGTGYANWFSRESDEDFEMTCHTFMSFPFTHIAMFLLIRKGMEPRL